MIPLLALVAGLVIAVPSAAQVGAGCIAFTTESGLYAVDADGTGTTLVRAGELLALGGWSPDGSRIAFTVHDRATNEWVLVVTDADGSDEHVVARGQIALGRSPWSPDGTQVAWGLSNNSRGEIFTANVSGGAPRQLTFDGLVKSAPEWSPDGSTLAYSARTMDFPARTELFTVAADGSGAPRQITPTGTTYAADDSGPVWSPSGATIAFARWAQPDLPGIFIIDRDGSSLRRVWTDGFLPGVAGWSPDGSRILFTTSINGRPTKYTIGSEVYSVDRDGTHATRLTNLGPFTTRDAALGWSPDGSRILFARDFGDLWTMNSDGTCEEPLGQTKAGSAAWQPLPGGPTLDEQRCHALSVDTSLSERVRHQAVITVRIANDGTEPLSDAKFEAGVSPDVSIVRAKSPRACRFTARTIVCTADLPRGEGVQLKITLDARRVGLDWRSRAVPLEMRFNVGAREPVLPTPSLEGKRHFQATTCTTKTRGGGPIDGTMFPDRICGRTGADLIHPGEGNDIVAAGAGPDVVYARDGRSDRITCGPGRDLVIADRKDRVARDCERVRRG